MYAFCVQKPFYICVSARNFFFYFFEKITLSYNSRLANKTAIFLNIHGSHVLLHSTCTWNLIRIMRTVWLIAYIFVQSITSRFICMCLAIGWNLLFKDIEFSSSTILLDPTFNSASWFWYYIKPFLRWDAEYFFRLAREHIYKSDYHHAFFPGFPLVIAWIQKRMFGGTSSALHTAWIGLCVSNISCILATFGVYVFSYCLISQIDVLCNPKEKQLISYFASFMYAFNPASIFLSSLYTESLFSMLTTWGMICLLLYERAFQNNQTLYSFLYMTIATVLLSSGTLVRSNGTIAIIPAIASILRSFSVHMTYHKVSIAKYLLHTKKRNYATLCRFMRIIISFCLIIVGCTCVAFCIVFPFMSVLGFSYRLYCEQTSTYFQHTLSSHNGASIHALWKDFLPNGFYFLRTIFVPNKQNISFQKDTPVWCFYRVPNIYGYVQKQYWDVYLFGSWRVSRLDRFAVSLPCYSMSVFLMYRGFRLIFANCKRYKECFFHPLFSYLLHLCIITCAVAFVANVEVTHNLFF